MKIQSKIFLSFSILIILFSFFGIYITISENDIKSRTDVLTEELDPSINVLTNQRKNIIESVLYTTAWVSQRSNLDSKNSLLELHRSFPEKRKILLAHSQNWESKKGQIELRKNINDFEHIISDQKEIISLLNSFDSYNDAITKMTADEILINHILPHTTSLVSSINIVIQEVENIKASQVAAIKKASTDLISWAIIFGFLILFAGILLANFMARIITVPIGKAQAIINSIANGKVRHMPGTTRKDEIGDMIGSINNLADTLKMNIKFAQEIGRRNFDSRFFPVNDDDELGHALVNMRDNLKESDEQMTNAQKIAKIGSWELNHLKDSIMRSDEFYNIMETDENEMEPAYHGFLKFVHPEDLENVKSITESGLKNGTGYEIECRIINAKNQFKYVAIKTEIEKDEKGNAIKLFGTVQDITEQKKTELEITKKNEGLIKTNMELDQFVYSVSHDLRAPLSSMLGVVEIAEEDAEDEIQLEHLGMLKKSINKLDGFIQDILDYSRNNRSTLKHDKIDFNEMIQEITSGLKYMNGGQSKVLFNVEISDSIPFMSDRDRLSVILNNLVSNAIRYHNPTIEEPMVSVKIDTSDTETNIIVRDNGIGIGKEQQSKIFDMFYRVSSNSIGSGLGLYIVKETVEKLNGKIEVLSELGSGTTFNIILPSNTVSILIDHDHN